MLPVTMVGASIISLRLKILQQDDPSRRRPIVSSDKSNPNSRRKDRRATRSPADSDDSDSSDSSDDGSSIDGSTIIKDKHVRRRRWFDSLQQHQKSVSEEHKTSRKHSQLIWSNIIRPFTSTFAVFSVITRTDSYHFCPIYGPTFGSSGSHIHPIRSANAVFSLICLDIIPTQTSDRMFPLPG
ncbi:hypothetical protein KVT40_009246 [Elsinoe batatas]|uniref:Uncharacterized protein n=1 Tax=Elsinoe batatas TaxID=2601811 RepID=A0A8K0KUD8_9PEZI|nr:hypothetical protein KVT40_009246 [Elsinoe batatas]